MYLLLDVVDLLQLQEIWSLRPIVTTFSRLERRESSLSQIRFDLEELVPRLTRLRHSSEWRQNNPEKDPARMPIRDFSETDFAQLYPETEGTLSRQMLFRLAYYSFVVAQYRGPVDVTRALLRSLVEVRRLDVQTCLDAHSLPHQGSSDWIPADITDEIRGLDQRYLSSEPGSPSAYVIADPFWSLLVKAEPHQLIAAARQYSHTETVQPDECETRLAQMTEVACAWNRSPSVVGLCYQIETAPNPTL